MPQRYLELHKAFIWIVILVAFGNFPEVKEDTIWFGAWVSLFYFART